MTRRRILLRREKPIGGGNLRNKFWQSWLVNQITSSLFQRENGKIDESSISGGWHPNETNNLINGGTANECNIICKYLRWWWFDYYASYIVNQVVLL